MKKIALILSAIVGVQLAVAQSVATDFTVADCNGQMYTLFDDLDAGKVVVITWIMPCAPCISPTVSSFLATTSFDQEKVKFLLVDDYANTSCSQLQTWASNYQMGGVTTFSSPQISMSDYGGDGMPKTVVVGCNSRKVYFNRNFDQNNSTDGLEEAIGLAVSECETSSVKTIAVEDRSRVYPNPSTNNQITITSVKQKQVSFTIVNVLGEVVMMQENVASGSQIDISHLSKGNYFINILNEPNHIIFSKLN